MPSSTTLSPRAAIVLGLFVMAVGGLITLLTLGVLPGAPAPREAPPWIGALGGIVFLFAGGALIVGYALAGGATPDGGLPPGTPRWIKGLQLVLGLGMVGALTTIVGWVAFGPGRRTFTVTGSFGRGAASEIEGRVVFGIGAALMAAFFVALLVVGVWQLRRRR